MIGGSFLRLGFDFLRLLSLNLDPEEEEALRLFGEYVGMAFQIKDDLFDYDSVRILVSRWELTSRRKS